MSTRRPVRNGWVDSRCEQQAHYCEVPVGVGVDQVQLRRNAYAAYHMFGGRMEVDRLQRIGTLPDV